MRFTNIKYVNNFTNNIVGINEFSKFQDVKFVELKSARPGVSLDGFSIIIMDYSGTRVVPPSLKLRGVIPLSTLKMDDHFGFVGE